LSDRERVFGDQILPRPKHPAGTATRLKTQRSRGWRGRATPTASPKGPRATLAWKAPGARLKYQVDQRHTRGPQAAPQAARTLVHWAKREKRETTPQRGQPHRAEEKTKQKTRRETLLGLPQSQLFSQSMRKSICEMRATRPKHPAGAAPRLKPSGVEVGGGRAAQTASPKRPRAHLHGNRTEHA